MQIINILRDYIANLEFINYNPVIDYLSAKEDSMSISPMQGGDREYDILGNYTEDYQFIIQIKLIAPSEQDSLDAMATLNAIGLYFESATNDETLLPDLGDNQEAEYLRMTSNPILQSRDDKGAEIFECSYTIRFKQTNNMGVN